MRRWRDSDATYVAVGGTGSISCVGITEGDAAEAASRRAPLGFRAEVAELREGIRRERREAVDASILSGSARPDWGEASWTAPDLR